MKLDSRHVHFTLPFLTQVTADGPPRFAGKEKTIHLRETAFVVEGGMLKVSFLGLELFFRRAITEYTSLTIPYQRMQETKQIRWPLPRLIFLVLMFLLPVTAVFLFIGVPTHPSYITAMIIGYLVCGFGTALSVYALIRIRARYEIVYLDKHNKRCRLLFRISSKPILAQFEQTLKQYVDAARRYQWRSEAVDSVRQQQEGGS